MSLVRVESFKPADIDSLVRMWRASFEYGVGVVDPHSIEEQVAYFEREIRPKNHVRVARDGAAIVGFLASNQESVAQLYVRVADIGRGIGRTLLDLAKSESAGNLWLFTFVRNKRACAFYESQGFVAVQHGFEPMWQLDDVKYAWSRGASAV